MPEWEMSTYGSNETLDLGFIRIVIVWRSGTKSEAIPDSERYEFSINGHTSKKKFGTAAEAKRIALSSARNSLNKALEIVNKMSQA